jgi:EAL domain-containing protein (putative c-di-GMP-specific phosphodiesterase class I)
MVGRLTALKKLGVKLALDDFGTGYSSLGYLLRFPIDSLKIDKSFVNTLGRDAHAGKIITSIIDLARRMHLKVVAEGVESAEQAEYLRKLDCDEIQGYLMSRPLPGDQALAFLDRHPRLGTAAAQATAP